MNTKVKCSESYRSTHKITYTEYFNSRSSFRLFSTYVWICITTMPYSLLKSARPPSGDLVWKCSHERNTTAHQETTHPIARCCCTHMVGRHERITAVEWEKTQDLFLNRTPPWTHFDSELSMHRETWCQSLKYLRAHDWEKVFCSESEGDCREECCPGRQFLCRSWP